MRIITIIWLPLVLSIVLYSCENYNDEPETESADFTYKAIKDNGIWSATKTWSYFNKMENEFILNGGMEDTEYFQEEDLNIHIEKEKIILGDKLRDFDAGFYFVIGGDGVAWRYEKTENPEESYLIIHSLDTVNKRISGEFEIRLKDDRSLEDYYMILSKGEFSLPWEDTDAY